MSDSELLELQMQGKDWRALDKALVTFFREQQKLPASACAIDWSVQLCARSRPFVFTT